MSDDPINGDLPADQAQSDDTVNALSPDEIAFLKDLKAYDNPEIYGDASRPQIYKLRLIDILLPGCPTLIWAEINGDVLPDALADAMFQMMAKDPNLAKTLQKHGNKDLAEFRRDFEQEDPAKLAEWREAQFFTEELSAGRTSVPSGGRL